MSPRQFDLALDPDLTALRLAAGLSRCEAAAWLGVHPKTFRRWERGERPIPRPQHRLLAVLAGALPWDGWHGFEVRAGALTSRDDPRLSTTPAELAGVRYAHQLSREALVVMRRFRHDPISGQLGLELD